MTWSSGEQPERADFRAREILRARGEARGSERLLAGLIVLVLGAVVWWIQGPNSAAQVTWTAVQILVFAGMAYKLLLWQFGHLTRRRRLKLPK